MKNFNTNVRGNMITYFTQRLGVKELSTGWLGRGTCPQCGKQGKFGVNVFKNYAHCFSCEYKKTPLQIVMDLEGIVTYVEAFKFLKTFESAELYEKPLELLKTKEVDLPEGFKLINLGDSETAKMARTYMRNRGYKILELAMKGVGYCTKGKFAGRIIIPFYHKGELIYFNAREFINTGLKHLNPSVEDFNIGKNMIMYNADCLYIYKRVYALESATNCLTLGDAAFGLGGKIPSEWQLSTIIKSPCREIVVILDPDAYWYSIKMALKLVNHKKIRVVKLPMKEVAPGKYWDVNDWGKKNTMEFVKNTQPQTYQELYRIFLNTPKPDNYLMRQ